MPRPTKPPAIIKKWIDDEGQTEEEMRDYILRVLEAFRDVKCKVTTEGGWMKENIRRPSEAHPPSPLREFQYLVAGRESGRGTTVSSDQIIGAECRGYNLVAPVIWICGNLR